MHGKDWFIVGTRLIGVVILFMGFQQAMTYMTRGMLFANLEHPSFFYDSPSPWMYLVNGGLIGAFALFLLLKTDVLADWCYGKENRAHEDRHANDNEDATRDADADFPSIKK